MMKRLLPFVLVLALASPAAANPLTAPLKKVGHTVEHVLTGIGLVVVMGAGLVACAAACR